MTRASTARSESCAIFIVCDPKYAIAVGGRRSRRGRMPVMADLVLRRTKHRRSRREPAFIMYEELAKRLKAHGFEESGAFIANKLSRGTFAATFFLATLAALELEGLRLEDL